LWNKVKRGLSAGRVQSVAVRIVVERDREIADFVPEEYWTIDADVQGKLPPAFVARFQRWNGEKLELKGRGDTTGGGAAIEGDPTGSAGRGAEPPDRRPLVVEKIERKERRRNPPPPFITSRLQQEASRKLRFTAKRTMGLAQKLYEGIDLGEEGPVGL